MTTSCSKCGFKEIDVIDNKKDDAERKQKEDHEKELLAKYRTEFCLDKEEAEKWITCFEEMSFGQQVYEHELQERSDNAYEQYENLKKLNISELEQTINKSLADNKYDKLILKEPRFNKLVEVDFTVQDTDTSRSRKDSEKQLEKLLSKLLIDTNWRLSSSSITYRLGYLVGQLNGYESEEDLLKLLGKKEVKLKPLDPELERKYGHSNTVQLYKLFAELKARENSRLKRLKDEPDGFLLNDTEGGYYSCNICRKSIRANETWWIPEGVFCSDCHRNIINAVIPRDAVKNEKIAFEKWDLKNEFGLSSATVNKAVKNGELFGRDFKDKEGKTYHTIYLVNENIDFFKTHPRTGEHKQRWYYVDKDGEIIWL